MSEQTSTMTAATTTQQSEPDEREPTLERQEWFQRMVAANVSAGDPPYAGVQFHTLGEVYWVIEQWRANTSRLYPKPVNLMRANLMGVNLSNAVLAAVDLSGAELREAILSDAQLIGVTLVGAGLAKSNLSHANLRDLVLSGTVLAYANLSGADLQGTVLDGTVLDGANLGGADLRGARLSVATALTDTALNTQSKLGNVAWNGVSLTRVKWKQASVLGEETLAQEPKDINGKMKDRNTHQEEYEKAVSAYQQLAIELRAQGMLKEAAHYGYRSRICERKALGFGGFWMAYAASLANWMLTGYGYSLWRIVLILYSATLLTFTVIFWRLGVQSHPEPPAQAFLDSFLVSLSAIHGRTVFEQLGAWSPAAWIAAVESVCGIIIEGVLVAAVVERVFRR